MPDISCDTTGCPLLADPAAKFCSECGSSRTAKAAAPAILCDQSPCGLKDDPDAKFCMECGDSRSMREDNPHARRMVEAREAALAQRQVEQDRRDLAFDEARRTRNYDGRMEEVEQSAAEHEATTHRTAHGGPQENAERPPGRRMTPEEQVQARSRIAAAEAAARRPRTPRDPRMDREWDPEHRAISSLDRSLVEGELYDRMMPHGHGRTALQAGEGKHERGKLSAEGAKALPADYHSHVRVLDYKFKHSCHPEGTAKALANARQAEMEEVAARGNTNAWGFEKQEGDENPPSPDEVAQRRTDTQQPCSKWLQERRRTDTDEKPEENTGFKNPAVAPRKKL